jgi:hypothetical protein
MAKRTPRKKHVAVSGVSSFSFAWVFLRVDGSRRLTTDDEECREGRDAAKSHFASM